MALYVLYVHRNGWEYYHPFCCEVGIMHRSEEFERRKTGSQGLALASISTPWFVGLL